MAIDPTTRSSRRSVLKAALGGAAVAAAGALATPLAAQAADDDPVLVGHSHTGTEPTSFENTDAGETSLSGVHAGAGTGVSGTSVTGVGVWAASSDATPSDFAADPSHRTAVYASVGDTTDASTKTDEVAVYAYSDLSVSSAGVVGHSPSGTGLFGSGDTGVFGIGYWGLYGGGRMGVVGDADVDQTGVYGFTGPVSAPDAPAGVGVYARSYSSAQVALKVDGRVQFNRSKKISVGATESVKKVVLSGVTSSSYVIATLQSNVSGLYVRGVTCGSGYFNIWLSKAPGKTVAVAYLVIN